MRGGQAGSASVLRRPPSLPPRPGPHRSRPGPPTSLTAGSSETVYSGASLSWDMAAAAGQESGTETDEPPSARPPARVSPLPGAALLLLCLVVTPATAQQGRLAGTGEDNTLAGEQHSSFPLVWTAVIIWSAASAASRQPNQFQWNAN